MLIKIRSHISLCASGIRKQLKSGHETLMKIKIGKFPQSPFLFNFPLSLGYIPDSFVVERQFAVRGKDVTTVSKIMNSFASRNTSRRK